MLVACDRRLEDPTLNKVDVIEVGVGGRSPECLLCVIIGCVAVAVDDCCESYTWINFRKVMYVCGGVKFRGSWKIEL